MNEEAQTAAPSGPNSPPPRISELVRRRAEARAGHDWPAADALKAEIEAAGWSVVDRGGQSTVRRTSPVSVEVEGEVRYGSAADVPSRLETPAEAPWTVAVVAGEAPDRVSRLLAGLRAHAPAGTHVVVVLNDPSEAQVTALAPGVADREPVAGREPEVLRTAVRLGHAAALNVALRRAAGELVLLADGTAIPTGDALTPLAGALSDQQVAVAGAFGLTSAEPGGLRPRALERTSSGEVEALAWGWLALRRSDYVELGPLDERFVTPAWLDVWLSLRLRAGADSEWVQEAEPPIEGAGGSEEEADAGEPANALEPPIGLDLPAPRRAVCLALPLEGGGEPWPPERTRLNRRNMYRVLRRFGWRADLFRTRADR